MTQAKTHLRMAINADVAIDSHALYKNDSDTMVEQRQNLKQTRSINAQTVGLISGLPWWKLKPKDCSS